MGRQDNKNNNRRSRRGGVRRWKVSALSPGRERFRKPDYRRGRLAMGALMLLLLLALLAAGAFSGMGGRAEGAAPGVRVIPVEGVIDPLVADYVTRSIGDAEQDGTGTIVLQIDTPGGLDESMRNIIRKIAGSKLPVIVYVAPSGARAASAGTYILMASDAAAMASGSNLGAAHPVAIGAEPSSEQGIKITNDSAAYMRALAEANSRNANWAELAVRQSVSLSADDALDKGVIEFRADSLDSLLQQVNGYTTRAKGITINTEGAGATEAGMSFKESLLHIILNPNVAYVLFLFGLLALAYEFVHPGIGVGAISGIIALLISLYAMYVLPVNIAGLVLIVFGVALLGADLYIASHGALSIGGIVSLIIGSFFLFDTSAPFLRVAWPLNIALALLTTAFFLLAAKKVIQARRLPEKTGKKAMVGEVGYSRSLLDPLGQVFVHGEIWSAEAPEGMTIEKGEEVQVTDVRGLMLKVKRT